jgi:U4/U6.U5 tri-snRNP-associated protein 2
MEIIIGSTASLPKVRIVHSCVVHKWIEFVNVHTHQNNDIVEFFFRSGDAMSSDSEDDYLAHKKRARLSRPKTPYLATINRFTLDFDFDKVCAETLSNTNVYACLICGRFLQGRGKETPAYLHSMEQDHHLFINLRDSTTWCLPENYEVVDASLDDIVFNLDPKFTMNDLEKLPVSAVSLTGAEFHPGLMGLNQTKDASYLNAVVHALCGVIPIRDYFVLLNVPETSPRLASSFSALMKRINNWRSFKGVTSPHELLQQVSLKSKSEFFASHADPAKFLEWFLPSLQTEVDDPIITRTFRGELNEGSFLMISLDLPSMPVFKGEKEFMPTVLLTELLEKRLSGKIKRLPEYLIIHFRRFVKNNFFLEKNSTMVRFPMKGLDLHAHQYSLVSSISHEGKPDGGIFKACVFHPVSSQWFECEALRVKKILPESVALTESYIQIWHRT